jgi:hypothetical protein
MGEASLSQIPAARRRRQGAPMRCRTFLYSPHHMTAAYVEAGWIDHGPCPAHHGVWSDWIEWPHDSPPVYPRSEE